MSGTAQRPGRGGLMLLDSASMYFRAFYGVPESVTAADGTAVNAVRGFLDMIARLAGDRRPGALIACLDVTWRPRFRTAAIPSYKAHRARPDGSEEVPPKLTAQIPIIEDVLGAAGIEMAGAAGYEADDVIATLARRPGRPVEVVTGDRDLFQVVDDAIPVRVLYIGRGLAKLEMIGEAEITRRYAIPGRGYADFAALRGDPSDGLPGVAGVGEKAAAALVRVFGSVESIVAALDDRNAVFPMGTRAKLAAARGYLEAVMPVVRAAPDVPLPGLDGRLPPVHADGDRLQELGERWNLSSPLRRLREALALTGT
jgi:5'-3' exonuclease